MRNEEARRGEGYQLSVDYELEPTELTHILGENFVTSKDSMEMESTICAPQSAVSMKHRKGVEDYLRSARRVQQMSMVEGLPFHRTRALLCAPRRRVF